MEALQRVLSRPTASPVAVADFKKLRRSMGAPASANFGNDDEDHNAESKKKDNLRNYSQ